MLGARVIAAPRLHMDGSSTSIILNVVLIKLIVGGGSAALAKRISLKGRTFAVGRDLAVDRVWLKF